MGRREGDEGAVPTCRTWTTGAALRTVRSFGGKIQISRHEPSAWEIRGRSWWTTAPGVWTLAPLRGLGALRSGLLHLKVGKPADGMRGVTCAVSRQHLAIFVLALGTPVSTRSPSVHTRLLAFLGFHAQKVIRCLVLLRVRCSYPHLSHDYPRVVFGA